MRIDRTSRRPRSPLAVIFGLAWSLLFVAAHPLGGQTTGTRSAEPHGSTGAAIGTAILGAGAGTILSGNGAIIPCSQTDAGPACVRLVAATGAALGIASGALIGANDEAAARRRLRGAGIGLAVGAGVALIAGPHIERFSWRDGLAIGALGAAIGTAPEGAGLGVAAGSILGLLAWKTVPGADLPDAVALVLGGLAFGAMIEWTVGAIQADDPPPMAVGFSLPVRL